MFQVQYIFHISRHVHYFSSIGILQHCLQRIAFTVHSLINAELRINQQPEILIISPVSRKCTHCIVTDADILGMHQMNAAMNPTETPKVLILQVRSVTIPINFQSDLILSRFQPPGDIELTGFHTSLAIPYAFTVYPYIESAHHSFKTKKSLSICLPSGGQRESTPVLPHRITFLVGSIGIFRLPHHPWRIYFKRISCRYIDRRSVSVDFPIGRNRKIFPILVIKVRAVKIHYPFGRHRRPTEFPSSIQTHRTVPLLLGKRHKSSPCRFPVYLKYMLIFPIIYRLGLQRRRHPSAQ